MDRAIKKLMNDIEKQINLVIAELNKLEEKVKLIYGSSTIPYEVESAFRQRLRLSDFMKAATVSSKTAASETQTVNEAGVSTYSVARPMNGFLSITLPDGTAYDIPYFT